MKNKKRNSKKVGIKLKTNKNNNIYFFNNDDLEEPKYILLEDNGKKLSEIENTTMLEFKERDNNKQINLAYKKYNLIYENKYTRNKNNLINSALIKKYCKNEVNSNIYIQLIHNNEDIKKIVSLYVNDVIYTLTTINEKIDKECISKITSSYYIKDNKIYTHQGLYRNNDLPLILEELKSRKYMYGFSSQNESDIFEYIKAISALRNELVHFNQTAKYDLHKLKTELSKYIYQKGKEFIKNSKLNIVFIMKLYKDSSLESELKKYYLYILNQSDKNLGLSIKKIMEQARNIYPSNLDEEANKKYNMLLKYYLYNYLSENKELVEKYVIKLRESEFEEKELIYQDIVKTLGKEHFDKIKDICKDINYKDSTFIDNEITKEILDIKYNWEEFILKIYALSKFLTIKETNVLTSSLINKLISIKELLTSAKYLGIDIQNNITKEYFICPLENIDTIIEQLRIVNSSRMYINIKKSKNDKEVLYSAVKIFKNNYDDKKINELLSEKMNNKEYIKKRIKNPIKNFIRNNVTKTKEFNYIMRYTNTKDVSNLLYNNPNLVEFLLKNLSENELEKYKSLGVTKESIASITLDTIIQNLRRGNMDYSINIKVYLKCIYFLIKNMVNINSYYFIAFSFYDRDTELILGKYINKDNPYNTELTEALLPKNDKKQAMKTIENFSEVLKASKEFFRYYRNTIDHININKNLFKTKFPENFKYKNYFKIYHYVLQNSLLRNNYNSKFLNECKKAIELYGTYSKNLLYVMNAIFMYNYARYKDISDETIFLRKYSE